VDDLTRKRKFLLLDLTCFSTSDLEGLCHFKLHAFRVLEF
jgi:hypothetical protein